MSGLRQRLEKLEVGNRALTLVAALTYLFLYGPIIIIVLMSFDQGRYGMQFEYTLQWYRDLPEATNLVDGLVLSIQVGIIVMIISTVLAVIAAYALVRFEWPRRKSPLFVYVVLIPLTLPIIIYGIGLFVFFTHVGLGRGLIPIIIGHVIYTLPFAILVVAAGVVGLEKSIEEAAMDLGADELTTFREVTIPMLMPNIIAAALFSFTLSFDEFLIALFVAGDGYFTLPVRIWGMVRADLDPEVWSISVVILIISIGLAAVATRLEREM